MYCTSTHNYIIVKVKLNVPLLPCLYSYTVCLFYSYVLCISARHLNVAVKNSVIVESVLPLGSSAEGAPPMVAGHTSMGSAYAFAYGMPILHFGGARRSGGCRYCHTAPWKRAMRRLAHGLTRSRGVTRSLARDVTWHCVRLHPIRLNRAFRSDLMWWHTFVEDWNGISFLPPLTHLPQLQMASGSWGCGAWHGCNWFQLQWDEGSADLPIMVKVYTLVSTSVEQELRQHTMASCSGRLTISCVAVKRQWRVPLSLSLYSTPFYTSRHGYKMCARVFLNGEGYPLELHYAWAV